MRYGGPEVLKFEEYPDPVPGAGRGAGSGRCHEREIRSTLSGSAGLTEVIFYPLKFPGLIGVDMAGTVVKIGPGVEEFSVRKTRVFAMADNTYRRTLCCESYGSGEGSRGGSI